MAIPLHARLFRYQLTTAELVVLLVMTEHCSTGTTIWASTRRIAAYAKLSVRQVKRVIDQLLHRHILRELAPANSKGRRKPATYAINEAALEEDPAVMAFLGGEKQDALPGISRPAIPGEPMESPAKGDMVSPVRVTWCPAMGDMVSPNPKLDPLLNPRTTPKPPAIDFQDAIAEQFERAGFSVEREVTVPDRGDGYTGRIDLVARRGGEVFAIECDCGRPREKSRAKLEQFPATQRLIVLREPAGSFLQAPALATLIRPASCRFGRCDGRGMRISLSTPGKWVPCECQRPD